MHFKDESEIDAFIDRWAENERRHKLEVQERKQEQANRPKRKPNKRVNTDGVGEKILKRRGDYQPDPLAEAPFMPSTNVNWGILADKLAEALKRKRKR